MSDNSLQVPVAISAKTKEELTRKMLDVQAKAGGKVSVVSIYFDTAKKEHVLWYLPLRRLGGGIM